MAEGSAEAPVDEGLVALREYNDEDGTLPEAFPPELEGRVGGAWLGGGPEDPEPLEELPAGTNAAGKVVVVTGFTVVVVTGFTVVVGRVTVVVVTGFTVVVVGFTVVVTSLTVVVVGFTVVVGRVTVVVVTGFTVVVVVGRVTVVVTCLTRVVVGKVIVVVVNAGFAAVLSVVLESLVPLVDDDDLVAVVLDDLVVVVVLAAGADELVAVGPSVVGGSVVGGSVVGGSVLGGRVTLVEMTSVPGKGPMLSPTRVPVGP